MSSYETCIRENTFKISSKSNSMKGKNIYEENLLRHQAGCTAPYTEVYKYTVVSFDTVLSAFFYMVSTRLMCYPNDYSG